MAKRTKQTRKTVKRKGQKRGPKEFVLKIDRDPAAVLDRLLNKPTKT